MKTIQYIITILCSVLLMSCYNNPDNPIEGKLDQTEVMNIFSCEEGQVAVFRADNLDVIKYTISEIYSQETDSTLSKSITMKGVNFDGNDFYTIETQIVCTNKKQIDVSFCYTLKIDNNHVYTQSGVYQYIDTQNTGKIPQNLAIQNKSNETIALFEYKKGLKYYKDNNNVQYNFREGTVNW